MGTTIVQLNGVLCLIIFLNSPFACLARPVRTLNADDKEFIGWQGETFNRQQTFTSNQVWVETLGWEPRAFLYHNFLTQQECDHLISLAKPYMEKSKVVDSTTGKPVSSEVRTSSGHFLSRGQDEVVKQIEHRIADFTTLPVDHGESLHVLNYHVSEKYSAHFDYFHDTMNTANGGQRLATMLMYLSDVEEGGETVFPSSKDHGNSSQALSSCGKQGLAVKPKKGDALLFYSLKPDGSLDPSSLHSGCPVIKGNKWSATKWIRQKPYRM